MADASIPLRLVATIALTTLAFTGVGTQRIIPGGPFISVTGDILPLASALSAICLGLFTLRHPDFLIKLAGLIFIVLATLSVAYNIIDVCSFWFHPKARGNLLGF